MSIITYENFKPEKIVLLLDNKKYLYTNETYQFKKVIPKYIYEYEDVDGTIKEKEDDIYIQIPEVHSYGIKTFENNDQQPSHSFSFVIKVKPNNDPEDRIDEQKAKIMTDGIINIFDVISEKIKDFLKTDKAMKALGKNTNTNKPGWFAIVDNIKPFMSYPIDKATDQPIEGSALTMFVKLKTENTKTAKPAIKTTFKQFNSETGVLDEISPNVVAERYQGCRCMATGVVHIEAIYISKTTGVSIQFKLYEVLITEILKMNESRLVIPTRFKNKVVNKIYESDSDTSDDSEFKSFTETSPKSVFRKEL